MPADATQPAGPPDDAPLANDPSLIRAQESKLLDLVKNAGYPESACFAVRLAFEEAVSNAFRHGHNALPADTPIRVGYDVNPQRVVISVTDRGTGFKPDNVPDPTLDENIENTSGRGLMLMRAYMTSLTFHKTVNQVIKVYERPS